MAHVEPRHDRVPALPQRETPHQEAEVMMALDSGHGPGGDRDVPLTLAEGSGVLVQRRRTGAGHGEKQAPTEDEALCLLE